MTSRATQPFTPLGAQQEDDQAEQFQPTREKVSVFQITIGAIPTYVRVTLWVKGDTVAQPSPVGTKGQEARMSTTGLLLELVYSRETYSFE